MILTFDFVPTTYSNLLAEIAPRAIEISEMVIKLEYS